MLTSVLNAATDEEKNLSKKAKPVKRKAMDPSRMEN
jgi:hypothetical protein